VTPPHLIRSFRQLAAVGDRGRPLVTLFSGGLDSSYLLLRLREAGYREVHALSVDLGAEEANESTDSIARELGAQLHRVDGCKEFTDEFIRPAILAHATYLDTHPISSSLSRPLIAAFAVDMAVNVGASMILHTANRSQNTLRRLNGALRDLNYGGSFGSPYDLEPIDRTAKHAELAGAGIDLLASRAVSGDSNLWCREYESGFLDDPEEHDTTRVSFGWTGAGGPVPPATTLQIDVVDGLPVAVDGVPMHLKDLIEVLNRRVGAYGLGRYSGLEHLAGEQKVLEVREMPAAWLIFRTLRHLETACLPSEVIREKLSLEQVWVREALEGRWYQPLRSAAQGFFEALAPQVRGSVVWRISGSGTETTSIHSGRGLYLRDRERWEEEEIARETSAFAFLAPTAGPVVR